jgi:hypothetical protein
MIEHYYYGYGTRTDNCFINGDTTSPPLHDLLYEMISETNSDLNEKIEDFYRTNEEDYISKEESFYDFCEEYYENNNCHTGWEVVLTDFINEMECNKDQFVYEDCAIHVPFDIPKDNEAKKSMLTKHDIERILETYLQPLVPKQIIVEDLIIHTD